MDARLALLHLRRAWQPAFAVAALALAALLARPEPGQPWEVDALADAPRVAAGLARERAWAGMVLLLLPALLLRAAGAGRRLGGAEADWAASRSRGAGALALSAWVGGLAGGLGFLAIAGVAAELAAGAAGPGYRAQGRLAAPALIAPDGAVRWRVADPGARAPAGSRARVEVDLQARQGPAALVCLSARRVVDGQPGPVAEGCRRLGRAGSIEVELPAGPGDLEFAVAREGEGAALVLEPAALLLAPVGSERAASLAAAAHLALWLAAGGALALGLGAWMSPGIALALLLALWTAALLGPAEPWAWVPGAPLPGLLERIGEGLVPAWPAWTSVAGSAAAALAGLALARAGLAPGRRSA